MSDWGMLEWIGAIAGGASVIGTIFGGYALFRRPQTEATKASASGKNSRSAQVTNSPNSMIGMDSPSALVIQRDLIVNPGYAVHEHERIMQERVAEARADLERAHQAEVDALQAQIAALTEPEWDEHTVEAAQEAVKANQFDRAEELMAEMEESHLVAASIPAAQKQVRIRQLRAAIALVKGDAKTASSHLEAAAGIIAPLDPESVPEFRNEAAMRLQEYGTRFGGDGIVEAIRLYRINLGKLNRETHPEAWAETQHNLGNTLLFHGVRAENGLLFLAEATQAFQAALQVCTRAAHPGNWAETQISLGGALLKLGQRCGGKEGLDHLAAAVNKLRAAGQVRTREADPDCWARIQGNLGAALSQQGVWRGGEDGVRLLGEAVDVYRGILEVRTRAADPLEWAGTQANLSCSLAQQGTMMTDDNALGLLNEAVRAARAALQVYAREKHPLDWARTHKNIGAILNEKSHRLEGEAGLAPVREATAALRLGSRSLHAGRSPDRLGGRAAEPQRDVCSGSLTERRVRWPKRHFQSCFGLPRRAAGIHPHGTSITVGGDAIQSGRCAPAPWRMDRGCRGAGISGRRRFGIRVRQGDLCSRSTSHSLGGRAQVLGARLRVYR